MTTSLADQFEALDNDEFLDRLRVLAEGCDEAAKDAILPPGYRSIFSNASKHFREAIARTPPVQEGFAALLARQRDFSFRTFGPGPRAAGNLDHIRKECREVEANPSDLEEWIDIAMLAIDGAWREGHSIEAILAQWAAKQAKNEARKWPDWRTADRSRAIEHDRSTLPAAPEPTP